jgi:hypothetical protein
MENMTWERGKQNKKCGEVPVHGHSEVQPNSKVNRQLLEPTEVRFPAHFCNPFFLRSFNGLMTGF